MELSGEGNYGLGDVKQVAITDDFASMDEQTRNCQTESSFEDCVTQNILKNIVENCKCLPYNLKNYFLQTFHGATGPCKEATPTKLRYVAGSTCSSGSSTPSKSRPANVAMLPGKRSEPCKICGKPGE